MLCYFSKKHVWETDKYKTWIREVFQQSWNKLTELITQKDNRVSNLAISTTVGFIVTLHESNNEGMKIRACLVKNKVKFFILSPFLKPFLIMQYIKFRWPELLGWRRSETPSQRFTSFAFIKRRSK